MIIGWLPRRRLFGDGWDADRSLETGLRFRLRILDGAIESFSVAPFCHGQGSFRSQPRLGLFTTQSRT